MSGRQKTLLKAAAIVAALILFAIYGRNQNQHQAAATTDDFQIESAKREFHAERTRVYHDSARAAEEWNGRPLTDFEKEELWQLFRSDAAINIDEKKRQSYDPSQERDH